MPVAAENKIEADRELRINVKEADYYNMSQLAKENHITIQSVANVAFHLLNQKVRDDLLSEEEWRELIRCRHQSVLLGDQIRLEAKDIFKKEMKKFESNFKSEMRRYIRRECREVCKSLTEKFVKMIRGVK